MRPETATGVREMLRAVTTDQGRVVLTPRPNAVRPLHRPLNSESRISS